MLVFDVSEYNDPYSIPFVDCDGVIARVTARNNTVDSKFYNYYSIATGEDKAFGAYKYTYAHNANDAHFEAVAVSQVLRGCNRLKLGFWLDLENDFHRSCADSLIEVIIEQYKKDCDAYGINFAGVYCDFDFYKVHKAVLKNYPIWIARWTNNPEKGMPVGINFVGWQYTNRYNNLHLDASMWDINKDEIPDKTEVIPYNPENVKLLQNYLNKYYGYKLDVDGIMGRKTFTAICQTIAK